jgi:hypothetical protein
MAEQGKIIAICANLTDSETMAKITQIMKEHSLRFGTMYISNAYDWVCKYRAQDKKKFQQNILTLADDRTLIIDGLSDPNNRTELQNIQQNIFFGKDEKSLVSYHPDLVRSISQEDGEFHRDEFTRKRNYPSALLLTSI